MSGMFFLLLAVFFAVFLGFPFILFLVLLNIWWFFNS